MLAIAIAFVILTCVLPNLSNRCCSSSLSTTENESVKDFHFPDSYKAPLHPREVVQSLMK